MDTGPKNALGSRIDQDGFATQAGALSAAEIGKLIEATSPTTASAGIRTRRGQPFAVRGLLWERPGFGRLLVEVGLTALAARAMGNAACPIDATLFDKIPDANWRVASHQDLIVPVEAAPAHLSPVLRYGVNYVEPPMSVLQGLLALRVHLDDCGADNGALAVVPGSHKSGKLTDQAMDNCVASGFVACDARAGDVLLMKPLLVHRSSAGRLPRHRRVLQVLYAPDQESDGLRWKHGA